MFEMQPPPAYSLCVSRFLSLFFFCNLSLSVSVSLFPHAALSLFVSPGPTHRLPRPLCGILRARTVRPAPPLEII